MSKFLTVYYPKSPLSDATADAFRYKKGDVVAVFADNEQVGPLHDNSIFVIVRVPAFDQNDTFKYMGARFEGPVDGDGYASESERKMYFIDFDSMSIGQQNQLNNTGSVTITPSTFKTFVKDRKTGQPEQ